MARDTRVPGTSPHLHLTESGGVRAQMTPNGAAMSRRETVNCTVHMQRPAHLGQMKWSESRR